MKPQKEPTASIKNACSSWINLRIFCLEIDSIPWTWMLVTWQTFNISNSRNLIRKNSLPVTFQTKTNQKNSILSASKFKHNWWNKHFQPSLHLVSFTHSYRKESTLHWTLNIVQRKEQRKIRKPTSLNIVKYSNHIM